MVEIRPGNLRDMCFIAANMCEWDRKELNASAVLESMTEAAVLSWLTSGEGWCWTAWLDDQPQVAFGISAVSSFQPHMRSAWCWGTDRIRRCIPAVTRFCLETWPRQIIEAGGTRVEVRSLKGHDLAHRWLSALKCRKEAEMTGYGVHGETMELWAWLKEDWQ